MTRREIGENHPFYASNLHNYGALLYDRQAYGEALRQFEEAIQRRTKIYGPNHNVTANSINWKGRVFLALGRTEEAEPLFRESLRVHELLLPSSSWIIGMDHQWLGDLEVARGDTRAAVDHFFEAFNILRMTFPLNNGRILGISRRLARELEASDRSTEAERYATIVVDAIPEEGPARVGHVRDLINLARVQMQNGRRQAAEGHLAAAEGWLAENPDEELSAQIDAIRG